MSTSAPTGSSTPRNSAPPTPSTGSKVDPVEEIRKLTREKGATCAMDCAGGEVVKQQAVRCTAAWGRIALVTVGGNLNVEGMKDVIGKQRTIIGSYTFSEVGMKDCAYFIADHGVQVDRLFTDRWKLEEADKAYPSSTSRPAARACSSSDDRPIPPLPTSRACQGALLDHQTRPPQRYHDLAPLVASARFKLDQTRVRTRLRSRFEITSVSV